jgi:hypothetical protein
MRGRDTLTSETANPARVTLWARPPEADSLDVDRRRQ